MRALAALLLLTGTAAAEDFALLDRQDATDRLQFDATYFTLRNVGQFTRLDAFGAMHVGPLGFYGTLPLVYESDMSGDSHGSLGNLDAGAFLSGHGFVVRAGIALPTSTDADHSSGPALTTLTSRLGDLVLALPDTTAARLGAAYEWRRCAIFLRFELGLDVLLDSQLDAQLGTYQIHANAGVGIDAGDVELTAETLNEFTPDGSADPFDQLAVSVRFRAGDATQLYLALAVPIDNTSGQQTFAAIAGITVR